jgi:hypothetical protein
MSSARTLRTSRECDRRGRLSGGAVAKGDGWETRRLPRDNREAQITITNHRAERHAIPAFRHLGEAGRSKESDAVDPNPKSDG